MNYHTTTPVPDRLAADLLKPRVTMRYRDDQGQERTVEFEFSHIEFVPRVVGWSHLQGVTTVPLDAVQSVEVDDEFTSPCDTDKHGVEETQQLAVARWHRMSWGELLRFVPQGNV